jgi:hypothetical protein
MHFLAARTIAFGQGDKPDPIATVVTLDLLRGDVKDRGTVPFDVPIVFEAELPESLKVQTFHMFYRSGNCPSTPFLTSADKYIGSTVQKNKSFFGESRKVTFQFLGKHPDDFDDDNIPQEFFLHDRKYCLTIRQSEDTSVRERDQQFIRIRTPSTLADYFQLDFGLGYAFKPQAVVGFVSLHAYAAPINKETNLADNISTGQQFLKRMSIFLCLVPLTIHSQVKSEIKQANGIGNFGFGVGYRSPFYGRKDLLESAPKFGRRILQPMRLNFGWMHYVQADANPMISKNKSKWTPFLNVTFDFNISAIFGPVAKIFGAL